MQPQGVVLGTRINKQGLLEADFEELRGFSGP